ncbi:MAG: glycosyltransferase [Coleofasciculaceae cyanobacterium]
MITFKSEEKSLNGPKSKKDRRRKSIKLLLTGVLTLSSLIIVTWLVSTVSFEQILNQLHFWQNIFSSWLALLEGKEPYFLAPTLVFLLLTFIVTKISPWPQTWSRVVIVSILLALTIRYFFWRSLYTVNLSSYLDAAFSLGLLALDILFISSNGFQLYLNLKIKHRHREADQMSAAVLNGSYTPSVNIFIPTYNEPAPILRRAIIGCQALDYQDKKVYLLDDTRRPEIRCLAEELGCEYITRPNNHHAKAGNINHALGKSAGELIAVFDADFVPSKNFLTRTIGFFQNKQIALVQTHQSFYNTDPVSNNLGLANLIPPEVEVFSRYYQLLRDGTETALCYGSSFVARRTSLEEIGGFVVDSISEDYHTGIKLSSQGYKVIYLGESLSAGMAAENMAGHVIQRMRWARGSLQTFFIKANPLTVPKLGLVQRLAHLEGLMQWFYSVFHVLLLLMPLSYLFLGVVPIITTPVEVIYFFLPYYLVQLMAFRWLNYRSRSAVMSGVYSIVLAFPLAITVMQTMLKPFNKGFQVTPKGIKNNRFYFNWQLALPLIILLLGVLLGLGREISLVVNGLGKDISWDISQMNAGIVLSFIWTFYDIFLIAISLLVLVDAPRQDLYESFDLQRVVRIQVNSQIHNKSRIELWGMTQSISEVGAEVTLNKGELTHLGLENTVSVVLEIPEEEITLLGKIINASFNSELPIVQIKFEQVPLPQQRRLVEMLYCRPGRWKRQDSPGELQSMWLLLKVLFRPKVIFERKHKTEAIAVSQV